LTGIHDCLIISRLEDYSALRNFIRDLIKKDARILILGCGNAEFSENMYDDGYERIDNIDISEVVIKQMKERNAARKSMTYNVMDARSLHLADNLYDLVVDKSTMDSLLCGEKAFYNVALMTKVRVAVLFNRKFSVC